MPPHTTAQLPILCRWRSNKTSTSHHPRVVRAHLVAHFDDPRLHAARHHRATARDGEHVLHRHQEVLRTERGAKEGGKEGRREEKRGREGGKKGERGSRLDHIISHT
eukprot:904047-Rhodomonas_salina.1